MLRRQLQRKDKFLSLHADPRDRDSCLLMAQCTGRPRLMSGHRRHEKALERMQPAGDARVDAPAAAHSRTTLRRLKCRIFE